MSLATAARCEPAREVVKRVARDYVVTYASGREWRWLAAARDLAREGFLEAGDTYRAAGEERTQFRRGPRWCEADAREVLRRSL